MKTLFTFIIVTFSSLLIFTQNDSIDCSRLHDNISGIKWQCLWIDKMPELILSHK